MGVCWTNTVKKRRCSRGSEHHERLVGDHAARICEIFVASRCQLGYLNIRICTSTNSNHGPLAIEIRRLVIVAAAFVLSAAPLLATTRTVNNLNDTGPESLRQRISESAANDTINFSIRGTITLTSGELLINKNLTISGPGANVLTVRRSTAGGIPNFNIFYIPGGSFNVTISGLTVANGVGGGISNGGSLTVAGCTISGNSASGPPHRHWAAA